MSALINRLGVLCLAVALGTLVAAIPFATAAGSSAATTIVVDSTVDSNDPAYRACTPAPEDCSLRGAITKANQDSAGSHTIQVPAGLYRLTLAGAHENDNATGDLDIRSSLTIVGAGAEATIIGANQLDRVVHMLGGVTVSLDGLQITRGQTGASEDGGSEDGGGIYVQGFGTT